MKKTLLLIMVLLATVGTTMAQDIYSAGNFETNGLQGAGFYVNGELKGSFSGGTYEFEGKDVTIAGDKVYYGYNNTTLDMGFVRRYNLDGTGGASYLDLGDNTAVSKLYTSGSGTPWTVGSKKIDGKWKAAVWGSTVTPVRTYGLDGYNAYGLCGAMYSDGNNLIGGYQYTSSSVYHGVIWHAGSVAYSYDDNTKVRAMTVYDNNVYAVVCNSNTSPYEAKVYKNNYMVYDLNTTGTGSTWGNVIYVESGDVYVAGYQDSKAVVWKNGEIYQSFDYSSALHGVWADVTGVYYEGRFGSSPNSQGKIYKDGEEIAAPDDCIRLNGMCVSKPECANNEIRTLPFYESFEKDETEWSCWTVNNVDGHDSGSHYYPFWQRWGQNGIGVPQHPYEGDYCAMHGWGTGTQEGWLISPQLFLQPGRDHTWLTFMSNEINANDNHEIWISTSGTATSNFTLLHEIEGSHSWHEVNVELTAYQGQAVYIAFKYEGTDGYCWYIDDVSVTDEWSPCEAYDEFPFEEHFDEAQYSLEYTCWYLIDNDHTGGLKCWQYDESNQCAVHPYGQNNGICQEGWMISPKINLTAGMNYTLTFNSKNYSSGSDKKNSVWIALDKTGTPDPADYQMIWEEDNYGYDWDNRTIDLSAYAGHVVNIAFKYEGTYAHYWYVDDVVVTAALPQYNINVEANNISYGNVTGGGTFNQGQSITIHAMPYSGYEFKKWTKDGATVSTNANYTFTVTENASFVGVFGEPSVVYYNITTNVNPAGAGTVSGANSYAGGTMATLVAFANPGWEFTGWQDGNTENPRTITVTSDANYTANFRQQSFTLTVAANPANGGNVTGGGSYTYGQTAELTATPNEGFEFLSWNDGNDMPNRLVTVIENANYVAHFVDTTTTIYNVMVFPNDPTLGEVTGGGPYPEGAEVTLEAHPFGIVNFIKWDDENTDNPRTITVDKDYNLTAIFEMPTLYTITVESTKPEWGSVTGSGKFQMDEEVTIQAIPNGGYYFDGWTDDNYDNPRTIVVKGDATYKARFTQEQIQTFTLTLQCNPMQGYVDGAGNYPAGTKVQVTATAYEGFEFVKWNDGNTENPREVTISENKTLVALFSGTGVDENGEAKLNLYPNPAKETVRIAGLDNETEVRVYNSLGMMVKMVSVNADQEINVSDLAAGLYTIRCGNQTLRFVKE